jgi:hypothetical protein
MSVATKAIWPTTCLASEQLDETRAQLIKSGFTIFELPGERVVTLEAFFSVAACVLPADPPLSGRPNIDAFLDSIWEGISCLHAETIALLWSNADVLMERSFQDVLIVVDLFHDIARSLRNNRAGGIPNLQFYVLLFGKGVQFPRIKLQWNGYNLVDESVVIT